MPKTNYVHHSCNESPARYKESVYKAVGVDNDDSTPYWLENRWLLDVEETSVVQIIFCPWCGERLE